VGAVLSGANGVTWPNPYRIDRFVPIMDK